MFRAIYYKYIMAKKKSAHPIHMHVPTRIGFVIVGIAVMVYGLYFAAAFFN
jgi:hypothetical protein